MMKNNNNTPITFLDGQESKKRRRSEEEEEEEEEGMIHDDDDYKKTKTSSSSSSSSLPPAMKKQKTSPSPSPSPSTSPSPSKTTTTTPPPPFSLKKKPDWLTTFEDEVLESSEAFYEQPLGVDLARLHSEGNQYASAPPPLSETEAERLQQALRFSSSSQEEEEEAEEAEEAEEDEEHYYSDFSNDIKGSYGDLIYKLTNNTSYFIGDMTYEEMADMQETAMKAWFYYADAFERLDKYMASTTTPPTPNTCRQWFLLRRKSIVSCEIYQFAKAAQDMIDANDDGEFDDDDEEEEEEEEEEEDENV